MKYFLLIGFAFYSFSLSAQVFDTLIVKDQHLVLFGSDDWTLNEEESIRMDSLFLMENDFDEILLEGHTDKVGSEKYNQTLSAKRVNSVKNELVRLGVDESKIATQAFGEIKPAEIGSDESVYKFNRRVVIYFFKREKRRIINGNVEEEKTKEPLLAKVKIVGKNFIDSTTTTIGGEFSLSVPDNGVYKLEISSDNHFFEQRFIKVSSKESNDISIGLPVVKIGSIYTLPNFNFKGDLPILTKRSVPTLQLLYELLKGSDFCIEIKGHINLPNRPNCELDTKHYKLSIDRAEMVFEDMVSKGIVAERMLPKGYGNWEMLFPKAEFEKDMAANRRVEIKIIDCNADELLMGNKK